jgi:hypothetical protein
LYNSVTDHFARVDTWQKPKITIYLLGLSTGIRRNRHAPCPSLEIKKEGLPGFV